jgi:hypothetical protein
MGEKMEVGTPEQLIDQLLGTSDKAVQLERISALMQMRPVTMLLTANPINGQVVMTLGGEAPFDLLYAMLDSARDSIHKRERQALSEAASHKESNIEKG